MVTAQHTPAEQIVEAVKAVTKDWCRQRRKEERDASAALSRRDNRTKTRAMKINEAAWKVLAAAYAAASGDGQYRPMRARSCTPHGRRYYGSQDRMG